MTSTGWFQAPLGTGAASKLTAYWRAANYLAVGQIYLLDNPLLRERLRIEYVEAAAARTLGNVSRPQLHLRPKSGNGATLPFAKVKVAGCRRSACAIVAQTGPVRRGHDGQ